MKDKIKELALKYIILFIIVFSSLTLIHIYVSNKDIVSKLNECLKNNTLEYCNMNVR